jgi:hypothetical protein
MEKIMSKTNETSNLVTLLDSELDAVSGGLVVLELPKDTRDYQMIHYGRAVAGAVTGK